jgi:hypothetical protein
MPMEGLEDREVAFGQVDPLAPRLGRGEAEPAAERVRFHALVDAIDDRRCRRAACAAMVSVSACGRLWALLQF